MSKYKAEWKPFSDNTEFWHEVLLGRKIEKVEWDKGAIIAIVLDSGERVSLRITNIHTGKSHPELPDVGLVPTIAVND